MSDCAETRRADCEFVQRGDYYDCAHAGGGRGSPLTDWCRPCLVGRVTQLEERLATQKKRTKFVQMRMETEVTQLEAQRDVLEEALRGCLDGFDRHSGWCGYNKDAPGDRAALDKFEKARAVIAAAGTGEGATLDDLFVPNESINPDDQRSVFPAGTGEGADG